MRSKVEKGNLDMLDIGSMASIVGAVFAVYPF